MSRLSRIFLAAALSASAFGALAQQPSFAPGAAWPLRTPNDHAYFCGANSQESDGTAPEGYGQRLSSALDAVGGRTDPAKAMDALAARAGCPRSQWVERDGSRATTAVAGAGAVQDDWGFSWPANSPEDIAWLCNPSSFVNPPPAYAAHVTRGLMARVNAGMSLADAPADIRQVAGCPLESVASQP